MSNRTNMRDNVSISSDASSDQDKSNNTSPTVYTRGDNTLWDDNELIRLWNEQLECTNITQTAKSEKEKQQLQAAISAVLDLEEECENNYEMNLEEKEECNLEQKEDVMSKQSESELDKRSDLEQPVVTTLRKEKCEVHLLAGAKKQLQPSVNRQSQHLEALEEHITMIPNQKYHHQSARECKIEEEYEQQQSAPQEEILLENNERDNAFLPSHKVRNTNCCDAVAQNNSSSTLYHPEQNNDINHIVVSSLPVDVRLLVHSFYNAGFQAGYYVAYHEQNERNNHNNHTSENSDNNNSNDNVNVFRSKRRRV